MSISFLQQCDSDDAESVVVVAVTGGDDDTVAEGVAADGTDEPGDCCYTMCSTLYGQL